LQNNSLSDDLNQLRLHSALLEQTIQGKDIQITKLQEVIDSFDAKLNAEIERFETLRKLKEAKEEELAQAVKYFCNLIISYS
jgi:hypothetical protein